MSRLEPRIPTALALGVHQAQRIEWLLSSDDGDESFILRTEEELKQLEDSKKEGI